MMERRSFFATMVIPFFARCRKPRTPTRTCDVPAAMSIPFRTQPARCVIRTPGGEEQELRPFAIVLGGTLFSRLDTREKIFGLQKPMPIDIRHVDLTSPVPFDRYEVCDYGPGQDGHPVHGLARVGPEEVTDILGRVMCDVVVGYTPESIAEEIKQKVLDAFRKLPEYADRQFDRSITIQLGG